MNILGFTSNVTYSIFLLYKELKHKVFKAHKAFKVLLNKEVEEIKKNKKNRRIICFHMIRIYVVLLQKFKMFRTSYTSRETVIKLN